MWYFKHKFSIIWRKTTPDKDLLNSFFIISQKWLSEPFLFLLNPFTLHCVKSVRIRSFSGPHFPALKLNSDQKNSERILFIQWVTKKYCSVHFLVILVDYMTISALKKLFLLELSILDWWNIQKSTFGNSSINIPVHYYTVCASIMVSPYPSDFQKAFILKLKQVLQEPWKHNFINLIK